MPHPRNHPHHHRHARSEREPFELPEPLYTPIAGLPRVRIPKGWTTRSGTGWPIRMFLIGIAAAATIFLLGLILALVFGSPL